VQWIKGGWINRNRIVVDGQVEYITLPVAKASSTSQIRDREFAENIDIAKARILKSIIDAYGSAPYFHQVFPIINSILSFDENNVSKFTINSIVLICDYIGVKTKIALSSQIEKKPNLRSQERILDISKLVGASHYVNLAGGQLLYDKVRFMQEGINLSFIKSLQMSYDQFGGDFIPWLSIIDVLMFNSVDEINKLLDNYETI
jgi:hypothetical protein